MTPEPAETIRDFIFKAATNLPHSRTSGQEREEALEALAVLEGDAEEMQRSLDVSHVQALNDGERIVYLETMLGAAEGRLAEATEASMVEFLASAAAKDGLRAGRVLDWIGVADLAPLSERVIVLAVEMATRQGMEADEAWERAREAADRKAFRAEPAREREPCEALLRGDASPCVGEGGFVREPCPACREWLRAEPAKEESSFDQTLVPAREPTPSFDATLAPHFGEEPA